MEPRQRREEGKRGGVVGRGARPNPQAKGGADHNETRRKLYATDPEYADKQRRAARDAYRKENPLGPSKLTNGLLLAGTQREVIAGDMDHPVTVVTYTIPEAARALGKSELTFKRWIQEDLMPEPILMDTTRGYRHYSAGEVTVMANVLARHEREFAYYTAKHELTKHALLQAVQGYRSTYI